MPWSCEVVSMSDMWDRVESMETEQKDGQDKYSGFTYFRPLDVLRTTFHRDHLPEDHFVLAYDKDQLIGVLLIQKSPNRAVHPDWWMSYIDVHRDYWRKGVATALFHALNNWVTPDMAIYSSSVYTEEGKQAQIDVRLTQVVTRCLSFRSHQAYWEQYPYPN